MEFCGRANFPAVKKKLRLSLNGNSQKVQKIHSLQMMNQITESELQRSMEILARALKRDIKITTKPISLNYSPELLAERVTNSLRKQLTQFRRDPRFGKSSEPSLRYRIQSASFGASNLHQVTINHFSLISAVPRIKDVASRAGRSFHRDAKKMPL